MLEDLPMPTMREFGTRSPGHEGAGVVVKVGSNVKDWKVGDRGGVKPMMNVCLNCEHCWGLRETYCAKAVATGLMVNGKGLISSRMGKSRADKFARDISAVHRQSCTLHIADTRWGR